MNFIPILMLSAVIVLGGCTQNAARKKQATPPAPAAVDATKTSKGEKTTETPAAAAKPSTQVTLTDKSLQTESVTVPDNSNTSTVAKTPVTTAAPAAKGAPGPAPSVPQTTGPITAPSGHAATVPAKPAPVAAPSEPVKTLPPPQLSPAPQATTAVPPAAPNTPPTSTSNDPFTNTAPDKASAAAKNQARLNEESTPAPVTPQARTIREAREKDAGPQTTTVVVIQPPATAATGPSGATGASLGKPMAKSPMPTAKPVQMQEVKIGENKATKEPLALLINKIRSLHAKTAERFEKVLKEVKFIAVDGSMEEAWTKNQSLLLVTDFKLPVDSDFKVIHLRDSVLLPMTDLQIADKGSRLIVEAILLRLAAEDLQNQNKKLDATGMATLTGLTHSIAQNLLTTRDRLNSRLLFDNLRYAQVSVADWKFDELSGPDVGGELIRISGRKFKLIAAKPRSDFKLKESASDESETCRLNFNYGGMVGGIDITTIEPEWNEFKLNFMMKEDEIFPLLPSMAGDKYLDLEIRHKNDDGSSQRFTLRYLVEVKNGKSERRAHHVVMEKLPAKGEATQMLMCAFNDGENTATPAPQEAPAKDSTATDKETRSPLPESTALAGPHAGSMAQRYRPANVNQGVTGATSAPAAATAKTDAPHSGSMAQRYRPANWNQAASAQTSTPTAAEPKKETKTEEKNSTWDNFYLLGP